MGKLGPHEGIELDLMTQGIKPAALIAFYPTERYEMFLPQVIAGNFSKLYFNVLFGERSCLFSLKGEEYRMHEIKSIYDDLNLTRRRMTEEEHTKIGQLLGYSQEDIDYFLDKIAGVA